MDDRPLRKGENPLAEQLIEENNRLRRERNECFAEIELLLKNLKFEQQCYSNATFRLYKAAEELRELRSQAVLWEDLTHKLAVERNQLRLENDAFLKQIEDMDDRKIT